MSLIRSFVAWNRRCCQALAKRFAGLINHERYHDVIRQRIAADLAKMRGKVLEVYRIYDNFFVQSIEKSVDQSYGMIISMTLLEHVRDNRASVQNMFDALVPGGTTHHFLPSAHHPYAMCLRAVGPKWQKILIRHLRPAAVYETGYPALFDHCSIKRMRALFLETGFEEVDVKAFYNANDYFAFLIPAWIAVVLFEFVCSRLGWRYFASGFVISARKPQACS